MIRLKLAISKKCSQMENKSLTKKIGEPYQFQILPKLAEKNCLSLLGTQSNGSLWNRRRKCKSIQRLMAYWCRMRNLLHISHNKVMKNVETKLLESQLTSLMTMMTLRTKMRNSRTHISQILKSFVSWFGHLMDTIAKYRLLVLPMMQFPNSSQFTSTKMRKHTKDI